MIVVRLLEWANLSGSMLLPSSSSVCLLRARAAGDLKMMKMPWALVAPMFIGFSLSMYPSLSVRVGSIMTQNSEVSTETGCVWYLYIGFKTGWVIFVRVRECIVLIKKKEKLRDCGVLGYTPGSRRNSLSNSVKIYRELLSLKGLRYGSYIEYN